MPDKQLGGLACSWFQPASFNPIAKAIEARQGGDEGSVHESAVGNADLPKGGRQ
jgi:hypothetical protein